ncbi:MAG: pol polyprotein, partial [Nitrospirales bacterium]
MGPSKVRTQFRVSPVFEKIKPPPNPVMVPVQGPPGWLQRAGFGFGRLAFLLVFYLLLTPVATENLFASDGDVLSKYLSGAVTRVSKQWGVAISPKGLAITSSHKEYIPVTIHFQIPEPQPALKIKAWQVLCGEDWDTDFQYKNCYTDPSAQKECPRADIVAKEVQRIKDDYAALYGPLLTPGYYTRLLGGICKRTPDFCHGEEGANTANITASRGKGRGTIHTEVPLDESPEMIPPLMEPIHHRARRARRVLVKRRRRQLTAIISGLLGLGGLGTSIANSISIGKIGNQLTIVSEAMKQIEAKSAARDESIKELFKLNDEVYAVLHDSVVQLTDLINDARCESAVHTSNVQGQLVSHIFEETVRHCLDNILEASFTGTLSPMLVSPRTLHNIIKQHGILKNTLMIEEPILAYKFAKVYPVRIDFTRLMFGLILEIPAPYASDVKPFYEVFNVGYNVQHANATMKVPLPQYAQQSGTGEGKAFTEIKLESCERGVGLWLCSPQAYLASPRTACLQAVLANRDDLINECMGLIQVQQLAKETDYATPPSGILLRTGLKEIFVTETPQLQHVSRGVPTPVPPNGVMWFAHGTYNHIVAGTLVLTSALEEAQHFVELPKVYTTHHFQPFDHAPLHLTGLARLRHANRAARDRISRSLSAATEHVPPFELNLHYTLILVFVGLGVLIALIIYCSPLGTPVRNYLGDICQIIRVWLAQRIAPLAATDAVTPSMPSPPGSPRGGGPGTSGGCRPPDSDNGRRDESSCTYRGYNAPTCGIIVSDDEDLDNIPLNRLVTDAKKKKTKKVAASAAYATESSSLLSPGATSGSDSGRPQPFTRKNKFQEALNKAQIPLPAGTGTIPRARATSPAHSHRSSMVMEDISVRTGSRFCAIYYDTNPPPGFAPKQSLPEAILGYEKGLLDNITIPTGGQVNTLSIVDEPGTNPKSYAKLRPTQYAGPAPLMVQVYLEGHSIVGMLDTGASVSFVTPKVVQDLGLKHKLRPTQRITHSASGHEMAITGYLSVDVTFTDPKRPGITVNHTFYECPSCPEPVLIGTDFLLKFPGKIELDLPHEKIIILSETGERFEESVIQPNALPQHIPIRVSALRTTSIPPQSYRIVYGLVESRHAQGEEANFEPHYGKFDIDPRGVSCEPSRVCLIKPLIPVALRNDSTEEQTVYANETLGAVTLDPCKKSAWEEGKIDYLLTPDKKELLRFYSMKGMEPNRKRTEMPLKSDPYAISEIKGIDDLPPCFKELPEVGEGCDLTPDQKAKFFQLIAKNQKVFSTHQYDLGKCSIFKASINTGDARPIYSPPYKLPVHLRETLKQEIEDMLKMGLIRPSISPWASPMLYVPKPGGKWRLCVDFRKVNQVSRPDVYPIPLIQDILAALKGAKYFSTLDLSKGFNQIALDDDAIPKAAFNTIHGQFEYLRLPFGLKSAPGNFQRCMERVLGDLQWKRCLIYIDDVLIFSKTVEEHLEIAQEIFDRLAAADLKLSISKCIFLHPEVRYLGHIISERGVEVIKDKIQIIQDFPAPTKHKHVETFLGMCAYYAKFIKGFPQISRPLYQLKGKANEKFAWSELHQKAFETLKAALTSPPVLAHPDYTKPFILHTDASGFSVGAVLSQIQPDGKEHPIAYAGRALKKYELNYSTHDKEALAIKFGVQHFRHFLYGGPPFTVYTDHSALRWLMTTPPQNSRLARWKVELSEYDFSIKYRPG